MKLQRIWNLRGICQALLMSMLSVGLIGTVSAQIEITEIMYNPLSSGDEVWEWIEVRNTTGSPIDLDGYIARKLGEDALDPNTVSPTVNSGLSADTVVPANGVAVIYNAFSFEFPGQNYDASLFRQAWGLDPNTAVIAGDFFPALSNGGSNRNIGFWADPNAYAADFDASDPNDVVTGSFANTAFSINYETFAGSGNGRSITWSGSGNYQDGAGWTVSSDGDSSGAVTSTLVEIDNPATEVTINSPTDVGSPGIVVLNGAPFTAGLMITEIMYDPGIRNGSSADIPWEWVEVYNGSLSPIDLTGYTIDDQNNVAHSGPDLPNVNSDPNSPFTGVVPAGEAAILFSDQLDPNTFIAAWGGASLNLIPVRNWSNDMGLNNGNDRVGLWDDPNSYSGDQAAHNNTVADQIYDEGLGFGDGLSQGPSLYLLDASLDPSDPNSWGHSVVGADGAFQATTLLDPNGPPEFIPYHPGGDQASPGSFTSFAINDADFDNDGDVDGRDFLIWQRNAGTVGNEFVLGDANGDGDVDDADLAIWELQYGTHAALPLPSRVPYPNQRRLSCCAWRWRRSACGDAAEVKLASGASNPGRRYLACGWLRACSQPLFIARCEKRAGKAGFMRFALLAEQFLLGVPGGFVDAADIGPVVFVGKRHELARLVAAKLLLKRCSCPGHAQQGFADAFAEFRR